MAELDKMALSKGLEALVIKIKHPNPKKKLINFDLYCKSCTLFFSKVEYGQPELRCKNGHLTVRILDMYEVSENSIDNNLFDNEYGIAYNEDGEY